MTRICALTFATVLACSAQRLLVYSPLTRVDPFGNVVRADRGSADPRDILSPGVPRNGITPLRVVVELEKPEAYWLEIGQNPENAVGVKLWKESFVQTPGGWIPDTLQEVSHPYRGFPTDFTVPGQKIVSFWFEMTVAKDAEIDRIKVEPQLYLDSAKDWVIYPMEVRVQTPQIPKPRANGGSTATLDAPADAAVWPVLCGTPGKPRGAGQQSNRDRLRDYVAQDLALADGREQIEALFQKISGGTTLKTWCTSPKTLPSGPEWYLRLRDGIYRAAGAGQ
jgi:hypothetical protein